MTEITETMTLVIALVGALAGAYSTIVSARNKGIATRLGTKIQSLEDALKIERSTVERLLKRQSEMEGDIDKLNAKIDEYEKEIERKEGIIKKLMEKVKK